LAEDLNRLIDQIVEEAAGGAGAADASAEALGADDVRRFFCEHWDDIKKVIRFLADRLGGTAKIVAEILIRLGDRLFRTLCPV